MTDQTRGSRLRQSNKGDHGGADGRKWIVTIGIDAYQHMPRLNNAVRDAVGIQQLFTETLGFQAPFEPMLDADATRDNIATLLEDWLPGVVGPDDSLVLFFAGHGKSRGEKGYERGYLAPVEARQDTWADYVRIREFLNVLDDLHARHIVAIIDACHSGFALGQAMVQTRGELPRYVRELQLKKSRRVLTSALAEQEALDGGPIAGHSLFTGYLIHGLRGGVADMDGNGVITASELGEYVRNSVATYSNSSQTPDYGRFAPYHDERGELVFTSGEPQAPPPPPTPATPPQPAPPAQPAAPEESVWTGLGKAALEGLERRLEEEPPPPAPQPRPQPPPDQQHALSLTGWWFDNAGGRYRIQQQGNGIHLQGLNAFNQVMVEGRGVIHGQTIQYEAQNMAGQVARATLNISPDGQIIEGNISWWNMNMPAGTFYIQLYRQQG